VFSIGPFSRITGLTIKTLRLYHEKGLLEPRVTDPNTGYRYYDSRNVEQARAIAYLRQMEFPLAEIVEILKHFEQDEDILGFLEHQRNTIEARMVQLNQVAHSLNAVIQAEREVKQMLQNVDNEIREKEVEPVEVAGLRWKGKYADTGKAFQQLGRLAGRYIDGKAINLYYDTEYKEEDAEVESCFQVKKGIKEKGDFSIHTLPGGHCVSILHKGPYDQLSRSYSRLFAYLQEKKYPVQLPIREIYLKGPGMIFKGNPKNYLTEIQVMIDDSSHDR